MTTPAPPNRNDPAGSGHALLEVRDLRTYFELEDGVAKAVDGVSFSVGRGRTLGIVGESGCGKSVTALSILRLIPPPGRIVGGEIRFDGRDLLELTDEEMRRVRGRDIAMVFQEPMTCLNPVFTVGAQIIEAVLHQERVPRREARARAIELLRKVRIPAPEIRIDEYPHQLSGGMRQRVMLAMALASSPQLLVADEPTTALDVTIQAQIIELLRELQAESGMAIVIITHDLGVVAEMADDVVVMYASKVAESGAVGQIFARPGHPYTRGLLASRPRIDGPRGVRLTAIPGVVPSPLRPPAGCRFHPRCDVAVDQCRTREPELRELSPGHRVACDLANGEEADG